MTATGAYGKRSPARQYPNGLLRNTGVLVMRTLHARARPARLGWQFLQFVILLVLFVGLYADLGMSSFGMQSSHTAVLYQSAALFLAAPAAFVWQSAQRSSEGILRAHTLLTRWPLDPHAGRSWMRRRNTAFEDRRRAAGESQARTSQTLASILALFFVDAVVYFVAATVWMSALFYSVPLHNLDNNLGAFIAALALCGLFGTAFVAVRVHAWGGEAVRGLSQPRLPSSEARMGGRAQIITDFSPTARSAHMRYLYFVALSLPVAGFYLRAPDMPAYTCVPWGARPAMVAYSPM